MATELERKLVENSQLYFAWSERLKSNGCSILETRVLGVVKRDETSFYSAMVDCKIRTPEGDTLNRCIVLRGEAVCVIPVFLCEGRFFTILVKQRRIIDGDFSYEFPAGGLDHKLGPTQSALAEVSEELGLEIQASELIPLTKKPLKVCESLLDEMAHWFAFRRDVTRAELEKIASQKTGVAHHQEFIELKLIPIDELGSSANFQQLVGLQLLSLHKLLNE